MIEGDRFLPVAQRGDKHRRPPLRVSFSLLSSSQEERDMAKWLRGTGFPRTLPSVVISTGEPLFGVSFSPAENPKAYAL
jgi:hypothetical protein